MSSKFVTTTRINCTRTVLGITTVIALAVLFAFHPRSAHPAYAEVPSKSILFLFAFEHNVPSYRMIEQGVRQILESEPSVKPVFFSEHMDLARFSDEAYRQSLVDHYKQKYAGKKIDLIIALNSPALDFIDQYGKNVFPGVPIIFSLMLKGQIERRSLPPNITGMADTPDFTGTLDLALKLLPHTQRVVVISGSTDADDEFVSLVRQAYEPYQGRLEFKYLSGLPMDVLLREVANLPDHTIIMYSSIYKDGRGQAFVPIEALRLISSRANAPIFGAWNPFLGNGVVGGSVADLGGGGLDVGRLALDILRMEPGQHLPGMRYGENVVMIDWRQMKRWNLSANNLPPKSIILYQEKSFWEIYFWESFSVIAILGLESFLIGLLMTQRSRRLRAEIALREANDNLEQKVLDRTSEIERTNHELLLEIEHRRQVEDALRQSEEKFRLAFMTSPDAIGITRAKDGLYVDVNDGFSAISGYGRQELAGKTSKDINIWANPMDRERLVEELSSKGKVCDLEAEFLLKDGRVVPALMSAVTFNVNGETYIYSTTKVIEAQKKAEKALRESEKRLRLLFESASEGILVNQDGMAKFFNKRVLEMVGCTDDEFASLSLYEHIHPDDKIMVAENYRSRLRGEAVPTGYPFRIIDSAGLVRWVRSNAVPIDWEGRPATLNFLTDITKQKQAEAEMANLESQLRQAQKMEAIGTLAGGIAHDFNNILGAIVGYSEMALDDLSAGGMVSEQDLRQVLKSAERAKALVRQILTFSRKTEYNLRPININRPLRAVVPILERTLPKMVTIKTRLAREVSAIAADPNQIEQIILNLASNSNDAMPEGGSLLFETSNTVLDEEYCREHQEVLPGNYVQLTVTDTGLGIAKEISSRIFDPFFTTKEVGKGTGLGLSTVYGIIKGHNGHIYCDSQPSKGTTFRLFFPALEQMADDVSLGPESKPGQPLGTETVLLVDDEEPLRLLGSKTLISAGYRVITAASGEEALAKYEAQKAVIDLVVMDLGMPGMGGRQALKAILEINPLVKIIIASGYAANDQVKAALDSGAVGYVGKPFNKADLLANVRSALDKN